MKSSGHLQGADLGEGFLKGCQGLVTTALVPLEKFWPLQHPACTEEWLMLAWAARKGFTATQPCSQVFDHFGMELIFITRQETPFPYKNSSKQNQAGNNISDAVPRWTGPYHNNFLHDSKWCWLFL